MRLWTGPRAPHEKTRKVWSTPATREFDRCEDGADVDCRHPLTVSHHSIDDCSLTENATGRDAGGLERWLARSSAIVAGPSMLRGRDAATEECRAGRARGGGIAAAALRAASLHVLRRVNAAAVIADAQPCARDRAGRDQRTRICARGTATTTRKATSAASAAVARATAGAAAASGRVPSSSAAVPC